MPVIQMLKGLPASGKTTYAKEKVKRDNSWVRVNKDDIRRNLFAGQHSVAEKLVIQTEDALIRFFMTKNKNIIVDDTNLNPHHERRLQMIVEKHNKGLAENSEPYSFEIRVFYMPLHICFQRNLGRSGDEFVPPKAMQEMYDKYLKSPENDAIEELAQQLAFIDVIASKPTEVSSKQVVQDKNLPHVILCDIDGTCALMGNRSPFEWSKVYLDKPNVPVVDLLNLLYQKCNSKIVFMSGRSDECRDMTYSWLKDNTNVNHFELFMRKAGDNRKDSIVKEELYREHIQPRYYVDFILDDRNQVVDMWRSLGLTCFQVAEGNF